MGFALLVFPSGTTLINSYRLLEGNYKDGRRLVKLYNMKDVGVKEEQLKMALSEWIKQVEN